ncbi:hypothetical protein B484DRAFT_468092, partial [Ochromonadaceae sp. CCMP2298]
SDAGARLRHLNAKSELDRSQEKLFNSVDAHRAAKAAWEQAEAAREQGRAEGRRLRELAEGRRLQELAEATMRLRELAKARRTEAAAEATRLQANEARRLRREAAAEARRLLLPLAEAEAAAEARRLRTEAAAVWQVMQQEQRRRTGQMLVQLGQIQELNVQIGQLSVLRGQRTLLHPEEPPPPWAWGEERALELQNETIHRLQAEIRQQLVAEGAHGLELLEAQIEVDDGR